MVGKKMGVDSTVGAGVEQRPISAVNRGKFVKIMTYIIPYSNVQYRTNTNPYNT